MSCEDKNGCLEKSCWKIDYQKSRFLISFFCNSIRSGLVLGPQNVHGRTFVKMQNLFDAGAGVARQIDTIP